MTFEGRHMSSKIRFIRGARVDEVAAEPGVPVADCVAAAGLGPLEAPCGGRGVCGKCRVRVAEGSLAPAGPDEAALLSAAELASGVRLACLARVAASATIELPEPGEASIATEGPRASFELDPPVRVVHARLELPRLGDGSDDESRLLAAVAHSLASGAAPAAGASMAAAGAAPAPYPAPSSVALGALPELARMGRDAGPIDAIVAEGRVLGLRPAGGRALGLGVDLGTTTVACRLVDLRDGRSLGARAALNAQRGFGADVVSRIAAASSGSLGELRGLIASQIASMADSLAAEAGAAGEDIVSIAVAGNPTMLHLLAGVPPGAIASSPFVPAFLGARLEDATALALAPRPGRAVLLLPGVSAYVGADIVAGMAAIGLGEAPGRSLYLDLGTNGEIACGGRGGIRSCAAAAGPAFEGAGIEMGMGGVRGAIDSAWLEDGRLRVGAIGGAPPAGICGSGLVDVLAALLDAGLVDPTGRIIDAEEARGLPPALAALRSEDERGPLVFLDEDRRVFLTQADVRAAQLAKAAIAAGIDAISDGGDPPDRVYLAGGFGSLVDPRSAARIGLIPPALADRAVAVGNASLAGATAAALSRSALEACREVRRLCSYVELSSMPLFNEAFVARMAFPEGS
jgi:uncharacterized 2Fe-2S/4Fe-4S cluster protein (DUF4445 family)